MTVEIIKILSNYGKENLEKCGISLVNKEMLEYMSKRVKSNIEDITSYQIFILSKISTAFKVAMKIDKKADQAYDCEEAEDMMDIPIEEFQGVILDEEFLKQMSGNG